MAASAAAEKPAEVAKPAEAAAGGGGGVKAMLPLILNIVLMPAIAFAMTQFVILPKLNSKSSVDAHAAGGEAEGDAAHGGSEEGDKGHGEAKADKGHGDAKADAAHGEAKADKSHGADAKADKGHGETKPGGKAGKILAPLPSKLIVNVAGTMGTRYLAVGITLVGKKSSIKDLVEEHGDQLKDAFSSALSSKTATDLERPGARNLIRSELITIANGILGEAVVNDLYFTEFATQ